MPAFLAGLLRSECRQISTLNSVIEEFSEILDSWRFFDHRKLQRGNLAAPPLVFYLLASQFPEDRRLPSHVRSHGFLITFLVIFLVLYLINMLPLDGRAKQIARVVVIIIGITRS